MRIEDYTELIQGPTDCLEASKQTQRVGNILKSENCQIFLVDKYTSLLYLEVNNEDSCKSSVKAKHTYLVLFDFYDSFLNKVEYFKNLVAQGLDELILINLPGQEGTQYHYG